MTTIEAKATPIELVDQKTAHELMRQHMLQLSVEDERTAAQYITDILLGIAFVEEVGRLEGEAALAYELNRFSSEAMQMSSGQLQYLNLTQQVK